MLHFPVIRPEFSDDEEDENNDTGIDNIDVHHFLNTNNFSVEKERLEAFGNEL